MKEKKTITALIIMIAATILSGFYGPWYAPSLVIILVSALTGLSEKSGLALGGFSLGMVFLVLSSYQYALDESNVLEKIGVVIGGASPIALILISSLIGMITGMLSGWLGSSLAVYLKKT